MTVPIEQRSSRKPRTSSAAASAANGTDGLRAQGLRTRNTIIRVARKLLLDGGPLEFSQRAVAAAAGISVSNLQYYFPTRPAVLRAVIAPVVEGYLNDLKQAIDNDTSPHAALDAIMKRSLRDAKDIKYTTLFRHFLSFAATDPECAQLLKEWYDTLSHDLAQLIRAVNPACGAAESRQIASLLIALADGLALQYGTGRDAQPPEARYMETAHYLVYGKPPSAKGK
ncbi:TetR/AcrR family transcriptional regulator [Burkholderia ubonensis]|uniref:TetR family transcriptional regulator n=1 Tax=Burkholderia ubonensis subsp. mesacidophila TaxID=265293 RepID=A0A2A4F9G8_9BURK|nr:TetR/AcrR family transcriptional regulator [Burkholderia ubonensis]PCE30463.1 TetR family transcriptional regulator [Burkholderia ubonensis subsp. mesacidophila]